MTAQLLDGLQIAQATRNRIASEITIRSQQGYRPPVLAVILVGDDPASSIYVQNKRTACEDVGIKSIAYNLSDNITEIELLNLIDELNNAAEVDGILVQLPLPAQINVQKVISKIDPQKDVDGFHPYNLGLLAQNQAYLRPCTPAGIMTLLAHTKENLIGKKATVVGTSNIVGLPMILELIHAGLTVTATNINTRDLQKETMSADLLVVATGNPNLIKGDWIKAGAIVIDVGMNRLPNGNLVGDVEFTSAINVAGWITPVPGGVGPMTVASLLDNTLLANIERQLEKKSH